MQPSPNVATIGNVAILLCTYNGQKFLAEQLDSIAAQNYKNWHVWASDDGSKDQTVAILESYHAQWGVKKLSLINGPAKGSTANFLTLTCNPVIQADYYAFSDQDDIWENDKLLRAVNWLNTVASGTPALYCSRTRLINANNQELGYSNLFKKPPSFQNALIQNIAGGNTMVFNQAACELLREAGSNVDVVVHDWWLYMVVAGCGGKILYDDYASLRYRQHDDNLIGMNSNWAARFLRIRMLLQGHFKDWNSRNIQALNLLGHRLTPNNQAVLGRFSKARNRPLFPRLIGIIHSGVYRQTLLGNLGLLLAALLNKI